MVLLMTKNVFQVLQFHQVPAILVCSVRYDDLHFFVLKVINKYVKNDTIN